MYTFKITTRFPLPEKNTSKLLGDMDNGARGQDYIYYGNSEQPVEELDIYRNLTRCGKIEALDIYVETPNTCDPLDAIPRIGWSLREPTTESNSSRRSITQCGQKPKVDLDCPLPGLTRGSVGSLIAAGGTGKSLAILQVAAQLTIGKPSALCPNQKQLRRRVAYLSLEDPAQVIDNRLHDLYWTIDPTATEQNLWDRNLFTAVTPDLIIADKHGADPSVICEVLKDFENPDLLIIDTARRCHHLDENSSSDMSLLLSTLEQVARDLNCAVLILHHASKGATFAGARGEDVGSAASRGSSVLVDNARAVWTMRKMNQTEAKQYNISEDERILYTTISQDKINIAAESGQIWLKRNNRGYFTQVQLDKREAQQDLSPAKKGIFEA